MLNMEPAEIDPKDLPEGFQAQDPHASSSGNSNAAVQQQQKQQIDEQRQSVLHQVLTPEALARLNRIKLVKDQKAKAVENSIISMALSGKLGSGGKINEGKLIEMLERGSAREAQQKNLSINIQRKKYAMDSDDEEDDDDL